VQGQARGRAFRVPKQLGRLLKSVFGLAGIAFLVTVFRETWRRSQGLPIPKGWAFLSAGVLILAALLCFGRAWVLLLVARGRNRSLAAGLYASQLGRYIPGMVWQPLAQVGLATQSGVSLSHAATAYGVHALVQLAAGGTVGAALALFRSGLPLAVRLSAPLALLPLLLLRREWLVRSLRIVGRLVPRTFAGTRVSHAHADTLVPTQGAILSSYGWTLCSVISNSVAFALLLSSLASGAPIPASAAAFGLSWTIGFLAIPFPSGIGVREGVLMVTIGFAVPRSEVIAASISQRLLVMVGEVLVIISSRMRRRTHPPPPVTEKGPPTSSP
jgi:hypothetical protein